MKKAELTDVSITKFVQHTPRCVEVQRITRGRKRLVAIILTRSGGTRICTTSVTPIEIHLISHYLAEKAKKAAKAAKKVAAKGKN